MNDTLSPELEFRLIRKNIIDKISLLNQLSNVIFVENSKGKINSTKTIKEKNIIRNIDDSIDYELKRHRIQTKSINSSLVTISDLPGEQTVCSKRSLCSCLSNDLYDLFIQEIKSACKIERTTFNYFKRNSFLSIFFKKNPEDLVNKILNLSKNYSWIIVSRSIYKELYKSKNFVSNNREESNLVGSIGDLNVYLNNYENEKVIYFGNYESITIIVNKNIDFKIDQFSQNQNSTIFIDYIFIENNCNIQSLFVS